MTSNRNRRHTVIFQPSGSRGSIDDGKTIMEASRELGVDIEGICGEKATWKFCGVSAAIATGLDVEVLDPAEETLHHAITDLRPPRSDRKF